MDRGIRTLVVIATKAKPKLLRVVEGDQKAGWQIKFQVSWPRFCISDCPGFDDLDVGITNNTTEKQISFTTPLFGDAIFKSRLRTSHLTRYLDLVAE